MSVNFRLIRQPTVPLEAEVLSPDTVAELSGSAIRALPVYHGKRQLPLGDFFDVEGERSADLVIHGNLKKEIRKQLLADFHNGTLRVITNCAVLTEGWDEPSLDCIIHAAPTKSIMTKSVHATRSIPRLRSMFEMPSRDRN